MSTPHQALIGLGANLGDAQATVEAALEELHAIPHTCLVNRSALYLTAPIEATGNDYVNAVAELSTELEPLELLRALQAIEHEFGRVRTYQNAPRTLDLDLLLFDQITLQSTELQLPHPRMHQRAFVVVPLHAIAPEILIPQIGLVSDLLPLVADQAIRRLS